MGIHGEGGSSREDVGYEAEIFGGCGNVDLAIFVTGEDLVFGGSVLSVRAHVDACKASGV